MIYLFLGLMSISVATPLKRISEVDFDRGNVQPIYMEPGRQTLIDFPCHITRASVGSSKDIDVKITSTSNQELDLWLKEEASQSTNLIVRCDKDVYVFDIIPSKIRHQDYIKIVGSSAMASDLVSEFKIHPQTNRKLEGRSIPQFVERSKPVLVGKGELVQGTGKLMVRGFEEIKDRK